MNSYPKSSGDTFMLRIPDVINIFRVLYFVFKDEVEF